MQTKAIYAPAQPGYGTQSAVNEAAYAPDAPPVRLYDLLSEATNQLEIASSILDGIEDRVNGTARLAGQAFPPSAEKEPQPYPGLCAHATETHLAARALRNRLEALFGRL